MNSKITTKSMTRIAMIAAIYVALTWIFSALAYDSVQLRLAEMLVLLAFYRREYGIGVIIGCFIANLNSPMLVYDLTLGVLSTIIPVVLIWFTKRLSLAALWPIIFVGVIVGVELHLAFALPLFVTIFQVAIGEAIVMVMGYFIFKKLEANKEFLRIIGAEKKEYSHTPLFYLVGGISLAVSLIMVAVFFVLPILQYPSSDPQEEAFRVSIFEMLSKDQMLYGAIMIFMLPLLSGMFLFANKKRIFGAIIGLICACIPIGYLFFLHLSIESLYVFLVFILLAVLYAFLLINCFVKKRPKIA